MTGSASEVLEIGADGTFDLSSVESSDAHNKRRDDDATPPRVSPDAQAEVPATDAGKQQSRAARAAGSSSFSSFFWAVGVRAGGRVRSAGR